MTFEVETSSKEAQRRIAALNRAPISIAVGGFVSGLSIMGVLFGISQLSGDKVFLPMLSSFLFLGITGLSLMQIGFRTLRSKYEESRD